jgi:hypothetical protein
MGGKGASSTVTVHNGPVSVDSDSTVEVVGLNDIKLTLQPSPLKTESKQELILPQPLKTETKLDTKSDITSDARNAIAVDLKPVAMDVCLNTSTQLPHGQISQPFSVHLGMTWMGVEFFGLNLGGESRMVMQDLPKKPSIDWPAQQNAAPSGGPPHRHHDSSAPSSAARDHGLRVRIK